MTAYAATLGSGATKYEAIQTGVTSSDTLVFTIPAAFASARVKASGADVRVRRGAAPATGFYEVVSAGASAPIQRPRDGAWTINIAVPSGTADVSCSVAEGDVGSADNSAAVAADLAAHVAAADPHPQYLLEGTQRDVSGTVTQVIADFQSLVEFDATSGAGTYNLLALASAVDRTKYKWVDVLNGQGANNVTITASGAETIRNAGVSAGTLVLPPGASARLWVPASGTVWRAP